MEQTVTAAGTVRNLAARAVMAASVDIVARRTAEDLQRAAVDARGAIIAQQREVIRSAFYRAVDLAYEATPGGVRLGCHDDGRVRIPLPWSGRSYSRFGLTYSTAMILRALIVNWPAGFWRPVVTAPVPTPPAAVFVTDGAGGWFLNLAAYPTTTAVTVAAQSWPTLDVVAHFEAELSKEAGIARDRRRKGKARAR